jgi:hypothetical protein
MENVTTLAKLSSGDNCRSGLAGLPAWRMQCNRLTPRPVASRPGKNGEFRTALLAKLLSCSRYSMWRNGIRCEPCPVRTRWRGVFVGVAVWANWGHGLRHEPARLQWPPFGIRREFPNGLARTNVQPALKQLCPNCGRMDAKQIRERHTINIGPHRQASGTTFFFYCRCGVPELLGNFRTVELLKSSGSIGLRNGLG